MKNALITGASGGIGLAIATQLANEGYSLTLVARNENQLKKSLSGLSGNNHQFIIADLSSAEGLMQMTQHLTSHHYAVLVNNAGTGIYGSFTDIALDDHMKMMRLNGDALLALSYAYLKNARKGDALVNIGSVLGSTSYSGASAYSGTKGFVVRFSESLWNEYREKGIYVCVFSPGVTSSNFHKAAGGDEQNFPKIIQQTPGQVAREFSKVLKKRNRPHVVSGLMNRSMLFFFRFLPRKAIVKMMGSASAIKNNK